MLDRSPIVAFVATSQPDRARDFYERVLGLRFVEDTPFALVFDANGTTLRIQKTPEPRPPRYTSLGWRVADVRAAVRELTSRGVRFERFEGMPQDEDGIWEAPGGARVAWLVDPDGHTLSLSDG